tara:strand:+ start:2367 stop:2552 length:186 start_codon:yes stop_codon:yes gene_type:complete
MIVISYVVIYSYPKTEAELNLRFGGSLKSASFFLQFILCVNNATYLKSGNQKTLSWTMISG